VAAGGDVGAQVVDELGVQAPPEVLGIHTNMPGTVPDDVSKALTCHEPLRVNIDPVVSRLMRAGRLGAFLDLHPEVSLDIITREQIGDLVGDGVDVAIRFGEPATPSLIAQKLADMQVMTAAAPSYLERHGRPKQPNELVDHTCIHLRDPVTGHAYDWEFHKGRKITTVPTKSRLMVSHAGTMFTEYTAGTGIAQVVAVVVRDLLENGSLIQLFADWSDETYAYHPSRHHPAAKVRAFVDFVLDAVH
jgi:DNA-binding transcriptional LysR family regulator